MKEQPVSRERDASAGRRWYIALEGEGADRRGKDAGDDRHPLVGDAPFQLSASDPAVSDEDPSERRAVTGDNLLLERRFELVGGHRASVQEDAAEAELRIGRRGGDDLSINEVEVGQETGDADREAAVLSAQPQQVEQVGQAEIAQIARHRHVVPPRPLIADPPPC